MDYFSQSDVASSCLRDVQRTMAFRSAIQQCVKSGDVVLDAGTGSGILSFFAAQAGARKIYAVEQNQSLCDILLENVNRHRLQDRIEVICADVCDVSLPEAVDVVVAELIETWLLDEMQLPALNQLRTKGLLSPSCRLIPSTYTAEINFGFVDYRFYDLTLPFPIHDWPDLDEANGWHPMPFVTLTETMMAFQVDFHQMNEPAFAIRLHVTPFKSGIINTIRLSGVVQLCDGIQVGETVAFNGNKLLPIEPVPVHAGQTVVFQLAGIRGSGGLTRCSCELAPPKKLE